MKVVIIVCLLVSRAFQVDANPKKNARILTAPSNSNSLNTAVAINVSDLKLARIEEKRTTALANSRNILLQDRTVINNWFDKETEQASKNPQTYNSNNLYNDAEMRVLFISIWRNVDFEKIKLKTAQELVESIGWKNEMIMNIQTGKLAPLYNSLILVLNNRKQESKIDAQISIINAQIAEINKIRNLTVKPSSQNLYWLYMLVIDFSKIQEKEINSKFSEKSEKYRAIFLADSEKFLSDYKTKVISLRLEDHLWLLNLRKDVRIAAAVQRNSDRISEIEEIYQKEILQWRIESAQNQINNNSQ